MITKLALFLLRKAMNKNEVSCGLTVEILVVNKIKTVHELDCMWTCTQGVDNFKFTTTLVF